MFIGLRVQLRAQFVLNMPEALCSVPSTKQKQSKTNNMFMIIHFMQNLLKNDFSLKCEDILILEK
jgi:hypothetical protein